MRARCRCFSVCSRAEATAFLDGAPRAVEAWDDPWIGYLRTVYGARLALPFDLERLEFFYLRTAAWARRHPGVAWPMPPCDADGRRWPACGARACAPWLALDDPARRRAPVANLTLQRFAEVGGGAVGVLLRRPGVHFDPVPSQWPIEVVRTRTTSQVDLTLAAWESCTCTPITQYGCWHFAAAGSGIVLNVRRTLWMPHKTADYAALKAEHARQRNGTPIPPFRSRMFQRAVDEDKHLSFVADARGYDTVQVLRDDLPEVPSGIFELVVTPRYACAVNPDATFDAYRHSPCVPVPITHANGSACACDHRRRLLNCDGSGGDAWTAAVRASPCATRPTRRAS